MDSFVSGEFWQIFRFIFFMKPTANFLFHDQSERKSIIEFVLEDKKNHSRTKIYYGHILKLALNEKKKMKQKRNEIEHRLTDLGVSDQM